jgi:hypothetical protein
MFDFKIGGPKLQNMQNRGTKVQLNLYIFNTSVAEVTNVMRSVSNRQEYFDNFAWRAPKTVG